jgi:2-polyprenyl-6-methoxyphenol hydroxylase-like FAD-dependent oxidoreductase
VFFKPPLVKGQRGGADAGREPRVLIVGARIAGLTLAASLERFGVTPAVVEIANASLSRGRALLLTGNVGLALRRVGLDRPVIDQGIVLERIVHVDPTGVPVEDDHDFGPSSRRYAPSLGITRDRLVSALSSAGRAQIRYSTTVTECDPVFRLSTTTGCFLGSFPVAPGMVYAFLLAGSADIPVLSRAERLSRFKELASGFHGSVSPLIQEEHDPAHVIFVPVQEVTTPSYCRGRVLLMGDAAHAFPPLLAQGAAMAIEDAVALAELLSGSGDIDQVLHAYELRRRPRVETIRAAVRHRGVARGMEGPVTPELLKQHPQVFSTSLKVSDELIEDPFAAGPAAT